MPFATYADANAWLDLNKIKFTDGQEALPEATSQTRFVKSYLADSFPDDIDTWDAEPTAPQVETPGIVREVTGMLMASQRYAKKYSEEAVEESDYPAYLYDRAIMYLEQIRDGTLSLEDTVIISPPVLVSGTGDFWPNDTTIVTEPTPLSAALDEPDRKFRMDLDL